MRKIMCAVSRSQFQLTWQVRAAHLMRLYRNCLFTLGAMTISGCVTPMTMGEQSPDLDYVHDNKIVIAVIDERVRTQGDMSESYIGTAQDAFGKTTSLQIYPWFVSNEEMTHQSLSDALEERIVFGLNDEGWDAVPAGISNAAAAEAREILRLHNAENLLVLTLKNWDVRLNLNWITPLSLDWDVVVTVTDRFGKKLVEFMDSGTDTVEEVADRSFADHIQHAYRNRLISILEAETVRMTLLGGNTGPMVADSDPVPTDGISKSAADVPEAVADVPVAAMEESEIAAVEPKAAANRPEPDTNTDLLNQLKVLQSLVDNEIITQQEYIDLVRRVVDTAGRTRVD